MKEYRKLLVGLVVAVVALLTVAATQQSNTEQPFEVGSITQFRMDGDTSESGKITAIFGKWVKLETHYGPQGPIHVRWINTDYARTISFPKAH